MYRRLFPYLKTHFFQYSNVAGTCCCTLTRNTRTSGRTSVTNVECRTDKSRSWRLTWCDTVWRNSTNVISVITPVTIKTTIDVRETFRRKIEKVLNCQFSRFEVPTIGTMFTISRVDFYALALKKNDPRILSWVKKMLLAKLVRSIFWGV